MKEAPLKFICDEQLGKLARWLRIIGLFAEYYGSIDDEVLIGRAGEEGGIILTRDSRLEEKAGCVKVIRLRENYPALQLREVVDMFQDRIEIDVFSRCVSCNGEVCPEEKEKVKDQVPPFVFATRENFTRCGKCNKVYWKATHRDRVEIQLRDILGDLYTGSSKRDD